jgi:hypothetical protein
MPLLENMSPEIGDTLTVGALDAREGMLPDFIPWLYGGPYEDLRAPGADTSAMWDQNEWAHYIATLQNPNNLGDTLTDTRENRIGVGLATASTYVTLKEYCDPFLGRPICPPNRYLPAAHAGSFAFIKSLSPERQGVVFKAQMANIDKNLQGLYFMYFQQRKADGTASMGWMSAQEKINFSTALDSIMDESKKAKLKVIWDAVKAPSEHDDIFEGLWSTWCSDINKWKGTFNAKQEPTEAFSIGEKTTASFLELWGIKTSLKDLVEIAHEEMKELLSCIERVRDACEGVEMPEVEFTDDAGLVKRVRELLTDFAAKADLPTPMDPDQIEVSVKDPGQLSGAAFATVKSNGNMEFYPRTDQDSYWEKLGARYPWVVVHEGTHSYQRRFAEAQYRRWESPLGSESNALGNERRSMSEASDDLNLHNVLSQLESSAGETARFIGAIEHHAGFENPDGKSPIDLMIDAGASEDRAEKLWTELQIDPWKWALYFLGRKLFIQYCDDEHGGDIAAGFQASAEEGRLIIPAHVFTTDFEWGEYEVRKSTPWMVREANRRMSL